MGRVDRRLALSLGLLLAGCSRSEPPPQRTAPWLASGPSATAPAALVATYSVTRESELDVQLSTREAKTMGRLPVLTGQLQIDLADLTRTRGKVRADVASIEINAPDDASPQRLQSEDARAWLDVGSSQPEAERERKRWAEFVITEIRDPSARAAYEGRRLRSGAAPGADAGAAEVREVTFTALGELTLHGYRVAQTAELRARFHYPHGAGPDIRPSRVEVDSRQPLVVSLSAHDIQPRDAAGVVVAADAKLLGTRVAREVLVTVKLVAGL